jgi:hypothetical protein
VNTAYRDDEDKHKQTAEFNSPFSKLAHWRGISIPNKRTLAAAIGGDFGGGG